MKIIIPSFAFLFVAAMTFAQEESPAPTESTAPATEEKASATVETTPEVAPSETTAPAAQKKEEVVAPAPAKAGKKEATATAAKPAAAAAASNAKMSGKNMSVKDMENAWEAAVGKHDVASVQPLVANDFAGVYWDGKVTNKSAVLGMYKKDKDTYTSARNEKLDARSYGPNVTVVVGTAREKGTGKDGKAFDRTYRFTDTWVMRNGQWQCVASQVMKVKG